MARPPWERYEEEVMGMSLDATEPRLLEAGEAEDNVAAVAFEESRAAEKSGSELSLQHELLEAEAAVAVQSDELEAQENAEYNYRKDCKFWRYGMCKYGGAFETCKEGLHRPEVFGKGEKIEHGARHEFDAEGRKKCMFHFAKLRGGNSAGCKYGDKSAWTFTKLKHSIIPQTVLASVGVLAAR